VDLDIFNSSVSATFNGQHTITSTSNTTFSFTKNVGNSASTVVTGSAYAGQDITGYVTVVAYGNGTELTSVEKLGLITDVRDKSIAGLVMDIVDPTLVTLEITGSVVISDIYEQAALVETIEDVIVEYLSPQSFSFSLDRVRQTQIISLISNIPGVVYVESLSLTPTGSGWLPKHGVDILFRDKGTLPILSLDDIDITYTSISAGT
jgi:predicted aconitase with swiveling domain